ncbi:MAG TPA: DUF3500 domain-containing protein [Pilimelia sp.]|nr:DUF3500 domain-containing protein [Pilimelia sp.]
MDDDRPAAAMRGAATRLLGALTAEQRSLVARPWPDDAHRRWLEYRPRPRPGGCLADFDRPARKAVHRLLATGLSAPAYAQAVTIMALEEVLDRSEGWARDRHSGDYWVTVFGEPAAGGGPGGGSGAPWGWRVEGHHVSVSATVRGDEVWGTPLFLGANPASVAALGTPVVRPLGPEEDLARALLDAMGPAGRRVAIVAAEAPADIRSSVLPRAPAALEPAGVAGARLPVGARALLGQLLALYLDRLPAELAAREAGRLDVGELHFAWEGPTGPGRRHYYRVQGPDLLIEYDNTAPDGSHAHTVLRRPGADFGVDPLADHHAEAH